MKIITHTLTTWAVLADWHGAERIVFEGPLFACCRFRKDTSEQIAAEADLERYLLPGC